MKSYLSVDLDYWMLHQNDTSCVKFFNKVMSLGKKIRVVQSHEELLEHVNESKADILYNIDYHSDLFGFEDKSEIEKWFVENSAEDGTWGVFVNWRKSGQFCWMHPVKDCINLGVGACWVGSNEDPFNGAFVEWEKVWNQVGIGGLDLESVTDIGVAISPDYTHFDTVRRVVKLLGVEKTMKPGNPQKIDPFWFDPVTVEKGWYSQLPHG